MKLTKQRLIEIIKEEIQDLNESPMGRAQMYAKGMSKDALRLLTYLKKGDVEKARYFIKDIQDALTQIEKNAVSEGKLNEASYQEITISLDDFHKVRKLLKPKRQHIVKHPYSKYTFGLKVDKKQYDKTLEILMKKRIDVQG